MTTIRRIRMSARVDSYVDLVIALDDRPCLQAGAEIESPLTVADVKYWLAKVEALGFDDDYALTECQLAIEVHSHNLTLSKDIASVNVRYTEAV
jgi:hypothetical protein